MSRLTSIIVAPTTTEKAMAASKHGKYTFLVAKDASKTEISEAIQTLYGVPVASVTTQIRPVKTRTNGRRIIEKRHEQKIAIVTTKGAKAIDVNKVIIK